MQFRSRPRRNRISETIRRLTAENEIRTEKLMYPLFMTGNENDRIEITSMPGLFRLGITDLLKEIEECMKYELKSFVLFPVIPEDLKDKTGSYSYSDKNFYLKVIKKIKNIFPDCVIMTDVALDPYNSDGHDGIVREGKILNDETLEILGKMSLVQAEAGADILGPSDMMDGRIGYIRDLLEKNSFTNTAIMSYTAKYASAFYGPFRDALESAPKSGDKKTYQMNPANRKEALRELLADEEEGADYLMVKPALSYLDIISDLSQNSTLPIAAYNVSGEYAMVKAAAEKGWLNHDKARDEIILSIFRAGADIILTYFAKEIALSKKI